MLTDVDRSGRIAEQREMSYVLGAKRCLLGTRELLLSEFRPILNNTGDNGPWVCLLMGVTRPGKLAAARLIARLYGGELPLLALRRALATQPRLRGHFVARTRPR